LRSPWGNELEPRDLRFVEDLKDSLNGKKKGVLVEFLERLSILTRSSFLSSTLANISATPLGSNGGLQDT